MGGVGMTFATRRDIVQGDHVMIDGKAPVWLVCHVYNDEAGQFLELERREFGSNAHQRAYCSASQVMLIEQPTGDG